MAGFDFSNHNRNAALHAQGVPLPKATSTGTTIVGCLFDGGVVIAGDRRATMGNVIAQRDIEKVFVTDAYSAAGMAGTAGLGVEMLRLFTVELEHYEKIEGTTLSLEGKANKLSAMVRGNLGAAMQGLAVVPLLVGGLQQNAQDPGKAAGIENAAGSHARAEAPTIRS